jgi:hypothetical protein
MNKKNCDFLSSEYNFIIFFSLPFYPLSKAYRKTYNFYGHVSLGLGRNVYQLHDPKKLRSSFLVSKMPLAAWLFEDGRWFEWDPTSSNYRHVHLYEKAEIKRTVIFYAALKEFPSHKQVMHENYFEQLESDFQNGRFHFNLLGTNCARAINYVFYREGWFKRMPLDFLPVVSFKRVVSSWQRKGFDFTAGYIEENKTDSFKLRRLCLGMLNIYPEQRLAEWLNNKITGSKAHTA